MGAFEKGVEVGAVRLEAALDDFFAAADVLLPAAWVALAVLCFAVEVVVEFVDLVVMEAREKVPVLAALFLAPAVAFLVVVGGIIVGAGEGALSQ